MEIQSIKRTIFWIAFFVFIALLGIFMASSRLTFLFKLITLVLLAFLSSMFRLEEIYSFLSIVIACFAGLFAGVILGSTAAQIWLLAFIYVIVFFLSCTFFEKKLLDV